MEECYFVKMLPNRVKHEIQKTKLELFIEYILITFIETDF